MICSERTPQAEPECQPSAEVTDCLPIFSNATSNFRVLFGGENGISEPYITYIHENSAHGKVKTHFKFERGRAEVN
jgi:hypothetical protein